MINEEVERVARAIYGHKPDKQDRGEDVLFENLSANRHNQFMTKAKLALAAVPQQQLNANALRDFLAAWFFNKDFAKEGIECNPLAHAIVERFSAPQQPALTENEAVEIMSDTLKINLARIMGDGNCVPKMCSSMEAGLDEYNRLVHKYREIISKDIYRALEPYLVAAGAINNKIER